MSKLKADPIYDWETCTDSFMESLAKLRQHISYHQGFVGWEKAVHELDECAGLYQQIDSWWNDEAFAKWWAFMGEHLRSWWC